MILNRKYVFIFILSFSALFAQNKKQVVSRDSLVGIWQANTNLLAAGLGDNYQFFKDGTFKYNFNTMACGLRRLWGILGNYKLKNNELILTITSTYESVGGHIEAGGGEEGENGFLLVGDEMKIIKQNEPSILHLLINNFSIKEKSLKLDFWKFYKLSNNPKAFD